jgi:hypothetical protein
MCKQQWQATTVCLAFIAAVASPLAAAEPLAAAVTREGERLLTAFTADASGPGVAVLVARGDEVLFRGARGMASIELGVALSADHVFRIGSVTKQFGAAGLLALVDQGKVPDASAFCPPGGKMAVHTDLIQITLERGRDGARHGQEIAHVLMRHGSQRVAQQKLVVIALSMAITTRSIATARSRNLGQNETNKPPLTGRLTSLV